jgi:glycosyl transferase family 25
MKAIVINLDEATERMAFQHRQLKSLGIGYVRLSANDPSHQEFYEQYHNVWERPLSYAEVSCFFNHKKVWEMIVEQDSPMLVLEDDAYLAQNTPNLLSKIQSIKHMDYLNLEARGNKQRKLIAKEQQYTFDEAAIFRLFQGRSGAGGYILWPSGAKKLLYKFNQEEVGIVDKFINASYELQAFQLEPAIIIQIDRCKHYGLIAPIETHSYIKKSPTVRTYSMHHKVKRISGQIAVALNRLRHFYHSKYRPIRVSHCFSFQTESKAEHSYLRQ